MDLPGPHDCRYCGVNLHPIRRHECRDLQRASVTERLWDEVDELRTRAERAERERDEWEARYEAACADVERRQLSVDNWKSLEERQCSKKMQYREERDAAKAEAARLKVQNDLLGTARDNALAFFRDPDMDADEAREAAEEELEATPRAWDTAGLLIDEAARLRAALEWYADGVTYEHPPEHWNPKPIYADNGDRARKALEGQDEG